MTLFLQELIEQNDCEHGCHDKVQTFRVESDDLSEKSSGCASGHPVDVIQS